jgi:hypothetical protein
MTEGSDAEEATTYTLLSTTRNITPSLYEFGREVGTDVREVDRTQRRVDALVLYLICELMIKYQTRAASSIRACTKRRRSSRTKQLWCAAIILLTVTTRRRQKAVGVPQELSRQLHPFQDQVLRGCIIANSTRIDR